MQITLSRRDSCPSPVPDPRRGSALMLTLMVVSLLMVVVLSFTVFVRLQLREVAARQNLQAARSRARLGADMAIAHLQELAGVDTRTTLPAGADASTPSLPNTRMWTGVRDTAPFRPAAAGALEMNPDYSVHLGWLVSSDGVQPGLDEPSFTSPFRPVDGRVLLVGRGSVNDAEDAVAAPRVEVDDGGYAYWVSDEASKAQINLADPFATDNDPDTDPYRAVTVQRAGTEALVSGFDPGDPQHAALIGRAVEPGQVDLLDLDPGTTLRDHFHDVTLASYGLPTHPKRGGLKRDLTPVLLETADAGGTVGGPEFNALLDYQADRIARLRAETLALPDANPGLPDHVWNGLKAVTLRADQADSAFKVQMFPPFTDMATDLDPGGPYWSQLLTWATMNDRPANSGGQLAQAQMTPEVYNPTPVIARFNLAAHWTLDWPRVRLHFVPSVILWNPYNKPLEGKTHYLTFTYSGQHMRGFKLNFRVTNSAWDGGDSHWTPQYTKDWSTTYRHNYNFRLEPHDIPAGAAVVFTMDRHREMSWGSNGVPPNEVVTLVPGLQGGGGFSMYVVEDDMNQVIIDDADAYAQTYSSHWNHWDKAGLPLFFEDPDNPGQADPNHGGVNLVDGSRRNIAINENGLDPNEGWVIEETVATFTRGGTSDTKLLVPELMLYASQPNFNDYPRKDLAPIGRQPWVYLKHLHDTVPPNLHTEGPESGIFPGMPGPPPSFQGDNVPFDTHPLWGLSWALRLPDSAYEYNTGTQGSGANLGAPIAWIGHYNPASPLQGRSGPDNQHYHGSTRAYDSIPTYIGGFTLDPDYFDLANSSDDDLHVFIGHSDGIPDGFQPGDIPRAILYEFPDSPHQLASPGAFALAGLQPYGNPTAGTNQWRNIGTRMVFTNTAAGNLNPAHPAGNSLMPPLLYPDRAQRSYFPTGNGPASPPISPPYNQDDWGHNVSGNPKPYVAFRAQYDLSWVLNDSLWDDFLLTPDSNSRLRWEGGATDRGFDRSARNVVVEGAFNVNSTSVDAWRGLLLGLLDVEIDSVEGGAEAADERVPFTRFLHPQTPAYSPADGDRFDSMSNYTGYRRLTLDEVDRLAEKIVDQVKARGPFVSLADFVNRRLLTEAQDPDGHRLMGALQAAIEAAGLNESQTSPSAEESIITASDFGGSFEGDSHFSALDLDAAEGAANRSAPGYLMQSDILARVGAVLQVRSDTFTIRAYGDTGDPEHPEARAWCEVLVQRRGDYVDDTELAETPPHDANPVNRRFGRKFEVIRFRWLSPEDV